MSTTDLKTSGRDAKLIIKVTVEKYPRAKPNIVINKYLLFRVFCFRIFDNAMCPKTIPAGGIMSEPITLAHDNFLILE